MYCTEIEGNRMFLNSQDVLSDLISLHSFEPLETKLVMKTIKKGDVVLDIGANIGYYTLIFAKLVGDEGKVFAIEPDPGNFALLEKNVRTNCYNNVVLVQKAASNVTGSCRLYLCERNKGMHRIYMSRYCNRSVQVECVRIDDLLVDYCGEIDFIKMDVEGSEWAVVEGMALLLKKSAHLKMMTEFAPYAIKESGVEPGQYLKLLEDSGFQIYQMNYAGMKVEKANIAGLLRMNTDREDITNLLCVK
jgi:FkbM family methyltransferase